MTDGEYAEVLAKTFAVEVLAAHVFGNDPVPSWVLEHALTIQRRMEDDEVWGPS